MMQGSWKSKEILPLALLCWHYPLTWISITKTPRILKHNRWLTHMDHFCFICYNFMIFPISLCDNVLDKKCIALYVVSEMGAAVTHLSRWQLLCKLNWKDSARPCCPAFCYWRLPCEQPINKTSFSELLWFYI